MKLVLNTYFNAPVENFNTPVEKLNTPVENFSDQAPIFGRQDSFGRQPDFPLLLETHTHTHTHTHTFRGIYIIYSRAKYTKNNPFHKHFTIYFSRSFDDVITGRRRGVAWRISAIARRIPKAIYNGDFEDFEDFGESRDNKDNKDNKDNNRKFKFNSNII
jgi:hypothetical protein